MGIGNPLLDIIIEVPDAVLSEHHLQKGGMSLVSADRGKELLTALRSYPQAFLSGGSAANTVAGVALLGGSARFVGVIGDDHHGDIYERDMAEARVEMGLIRHESEPTGYAITLVTPDGERTFATFLGAAACFRKEHIDVAAIKESRILHVEGYLLSGEESREAVIEAVRCANEGETLVSIDLSARGVILEHLDTVKQIVSDNADIVFVNEEEALALTGKADMDALHEIAEFCPIAVVKLGAKGSLVKRHGKVHRIDPHPVVMVNTNGAGDMYAAGFLHGLARGHDTEAMGYIASVAAGLVVSSEGARMHTSHHGTIRRVLEKYTKSK